MLHHALLRSSLHVLFRASVTPWAALRIQRIAAQVARASTYTGKPEYSPEDLTQQWASYRRARRWRYFRNFTFLSLGFFPVWLLLHPPDDPLLSEALSHNLANLPQVRQLLDDAATKPLDQCYAEIDLSRRGSASLTDKTLKGGNLLGPQRAFWSDSEQELLVFVWFGVLLNGWPGVVHGGAIGTVISDAMSVAAGCTRPSIADPSSLSITYMKPTNIRSFYVIRVRPLHPDSDDAAGPSLPPKGSSLDRVEHEVSPQEDMTKQPLPSVPPQSGEEHQEFEATLEKLNGKVLVKARASFIQAR